MSICAKRIRSFVGFWSALLAVFNTVRVEQIVSDLYDRTVCFKSMFLRHGGQDVAAPFACVIDVAAGLLVTLEFCALFCALCGRSLQHCRIERVDPVEDSSPSFIFLRDSGYWATASRGLTREPARTIQACYDFSGD